MSCTTTIGVDEHPTHLILAVDPGINGGYALCFDNEDGTRLFQAHKFVDATSLLTHLGNLPDKISHAYVEKVHSSQVMSPKAAFTFGHNAGTWETALLALAIPHTYIHPQNWQKPHREQLAGMEYAQRKHVLKEIAALRFPDIRVTFANCDALLIAEYGLKEFYNPTGKSVDKS
jgi:hypothetical protein